MTQSTKYYHIYSSTMSPCSIDLLERQRLSIEAMCEACNGPRMDCHAIHICLQQRIGIQKPLSFVSGGFPGIILRKFLESFDEVSVRRDLFIGNVFGPKEELLEEWATFHGRYRLIIRGAKDVSHRVCETCHRVIYYGGGKRYLFPVPPDDAGIFESDLSGLIVRSDAFKKLDLTPWRRKIYVDELFVPDEPLDGLGSLNSY